MANTKKELSLARVASETDISREAVIIDSLVGAIVLSSQAKVIKEGEYFPADVTTDASVALAREAATAMLRTALKGGIDIADFESLLFESQADEDHDAITPEDFSERTTSYRSYKDNITSRRNGGLNGNSN